jgi:branched-chain amino acid aminotransferase
VKPFPADRIARGLSLVVSTVRRDARSPLSAFKTISRADTVYAKLEATRAGADDALFLTTDGHLSEATTANLFLVRGGELATPSLDSAILAGTTRSWALRWGAEAGLDVREDLLPLETLLQADEAFLTSSVAGILPVTSLIDADGAARPIGNGRPGRRTLEARSARERFICE